MQLTAAPHCPFEPQVWTPLPEHCVLPGEHEPVQAPPLQTLGQSDPLICQVPEPSHVCGCCALHCIAPGVHDPVHAPALHT